VSLKEIEGTEIELEYEEESRVAVETVFHLLGAKRTKKVKAAVDQFGRAWFPGVPVGAICRLRVLTGVEEQVGVPERVPAPTWGEIVLRFRMGRALALAAETAQAEEELPYTQEMRLEDGVLLCTVYLDEDGREVVEFRTDSDKMEGRSVRCTILKGSEEVGPFLVPLERGYRGVLTGRFYLREKLGESTRETFRILFGPEPPEGQEGVEKEQV
jgi:hypothetical protein